MRHNLGRVVATAAVAAAVPHHQITALLDRHAAGDWGDLSNNYNANEQPGVDVVKEHVRMELTYTSSTL